MTGILKLAGFYLALTAMVLRALIPAGWMPSPSALTHLTICTPTGPMPMELGPDRKQQEPAAPQDGAHHNDACPFGALQQVAATPTQAVFWTPIAWNTTKPPAVLHVVVSRAETHRPQSPRAPPVVT